MSEEISLVGKMVRETTHTPKLETTRRMLPVFKKVVGFKEVVEYLEQAPLPADIFKVSHTISFTFFKTILLIPYVFPESADFKLGWESLGFIRPHSNRVYLSPIFMWCRAQYFVKLKTMLNPLLHDKKFRHQTQCCDK